MCTVCNCAFEHKYGKTSKAGDICCRCSRKRVEEQEHNPGEPENKFAEENAMNFYLRWMQFFRPVFDGKESELDRFTKELQVLAAGKPVG